MLVLITVASYLRHTQTAAMINNNMRRSYFIEAEGER